MLIRLARGFTRLSEKYSKMEHGCERFLKVMNEYFSRLVAVVEEYNGDIVCFAGDALLAVFKDEDPSEAARLAAYCCMQLVDQESPYTSSDGTVLRLHSTVASGKLTLVDLGTPALLA